MTDIVYPLDNIIKRSNNPKDILLIYLPDKTAIKVQDKLFYDSDSVDLFLNQNIWCIDKYTGRISYNGKIFKINDNWLSLRCNNKNIFIDTNEYYIFIGYTKSKKNDYQYFQALLNML